MYVWYTTKASPAYTNARLDAHMPVQNHTAYTGYTLAFTAVSLSGREDV